MHMNFRMVEAFSGHKMKISSYFIDIQEPMDVASFPFFFLYLLEKALSYALKWHLKSTSNQEKQKPNACDETFQEIGS